MKNALMLLACSMLCCQRPIAKKPAPVAVAAPRENVVNASIHHIREQFDLGDVNGDGKKDRATVQFEFNFDTNQVACNKPNCYINIGFGPRIPDLDIKESLGIFVRTAPDLNGDKRDDILLFSRTYESNWNVVFAYALVDGEWTELARTKCFFTDDADADNRIAKDKKGYSLLGDQWNEDKGGVFARSTKTRILAPRENR